MAVENTHTENLVDNDRKFLIDPQTRTIKNASCDKELVQYDSSSEVFTFEMPRYVEGHDMGTAKNVKVYYVNKGASEEIVDSTDVTSTLKITDDGTNTAVFSWTIPANATQHEGTLDFAVTFTCPEVSPDYIWSTKIYSGIVINKGLRNSSEIIKRDPDAFDAILTRVSEAENKVDEMMKATPIKKNVAFKSEQVYMGSGNYGQYVTVKIDENEYDVTNGYPENLTFEQLRTAIIESIKSGGVISASNEAITIPAFNNCILSGADNEGNNPTEINFTNSYIEYTYAPPMSGDPDIFYLREASLSKLTINADGVSLQIGGVRSYETPVYLRVDFYSNGLALRELQYSSSKGGGNIQAADMWNNNDKIKRMVMDRPLIWLHGADNKTYLFSSFYEKNTGVSDTYEMYLTFGGKYTLKIDKTGASLSNV